MAKQNTQSRLKGRTAANKRTPDGDVETTEDFPLSNLQLDGGNARLGAKAGQLKNQTEILDTVVETFSVDDILSSLAVNGYFRAEPMVGVRIGKGDQALIKEGNRRLAACLILAGEERARNHSKRATEYQRLQAQHDRDPITHVPVRIVSDSRSLLSYLGVRHIAASQPWDSYAKAAWIAKAVKDGGLSLEDVSSMIGDQHKTVARSLEGYYFVNQLIDAAQFAPDDSLRRGRGSNTAYPFSWIYTALGYGPIREWLNLTDLSHEKREKKPVKVNKLADAAELLVFLFGNKSKGRSAAITDTRQLPDLAKAIADPESRRWLKRGKTTEEVAHLLKPAKERVTESLLDAQDALTNALNPLSQGEVNREEAGDLASSSKKVRSLAVNVDKKITSIAQADEDE